MSLFLLENAWSISFDFSKHCEEKRYQNQCYTINSKSQTFIIIICVYRAESGSFCKFLRLLDRTLNFLNKPNTEFLICGEINVDYLCNNDEKQQVSVTKYI